MVVVMRKDLNMRKGKMVAQGGHSVMKFFCDRNTSTNPYQIVVDLTDPEMLWTQNSFTKIVLGCGSEAELLVLIEKAKQLGVQCMPIVDNGVTEFNGVKTLTCASFGPDYVDVIDPITGHLSPL